MNELIRSHNTFLRLFIPLLLIAFFNCPNKYGHISAQQDITVYKQANDMVKTIEKFHIKPKPVNDEFSKLVFESFLEMLDPYGIYLDVLEIDKLSDYQILVDNEILAKKGSFMQVTSKLFEQKLKQTDSLLNTFYKVEFDFEVNDTFNIKNINYTDNAKLHDRLKKFIKLQALSMLFYGNDSVNSAYDNSRIRLVVDRVISNNRCRIKSILDGGTENYISTIFLKSIASVFDPHTSFFSKEEENLFQNEISKDINSFGISIKKNDSGEIEIIEIIPGSSAWNTNLLNEGDVILGVEVSNERKEFNCIDLMEAIEFLVSEKYNAATFLIRKKNGKEIGLNLQKNRIKVDENIIKSFIIEGEHKIGYIYLPSFYSQTNTSNYMFNGSASDVAKELVQLKKENIEGLIFDIRNNGGGSMLEAVLLSGIFINYGAVGIGQIKDELPYTLKDINRGTTFDLPLLILINGFSASASEFFAATMQDYNRAIIVGSESFGKSTMQQIVPIDAYKYDKLEDYIGKPDAYVKITTGIFYRVTGKSHQKIGIIPDIDLPDIYDKIELGESSYFNAIDTLSVNKKTYYYPLKKLPVDELKEKSTTRLQSDLIYNKVREQSIYFSNIQNSTSIPLHKEYFSRNSLLYEIKNSNPGFSIKMPVYRDIGLSRFEDYQSEINKINIENIKNDMYINEAYSIILDLITLNKK